MIRKSIKPENNSGFNTVEVREYLPAAKCYRCALLLIEEGEVIKLEEPYIFQEVNDEFRLSEEEKQSLNIPNYEAFK